MKILVSAGVLFLVSLPALASIYEQQWALENTAQTVCRFDGKNCLKGKSNSDIKYQNALKKNQDCSAVIVAVLDTGADLSHPDLQGNLIPGRNMVGDNNDPQDDNLHGTHVSGIIAGNGDENSGVVGVCHKAKLMPVKVGSAEGSLTDSDIIEGIQFASKKGARIVNASFGGGPSSSIMKSAFAKADRILFVIAAGNGDMFGRGYDIDKQAQYPASYALPNILVVAATDSRDRLASFSNFGVATVHLAAPGVNIVSTMPMVKTKEMEAAEIPIEFGAIDGTSMATPYVTGAAALYWSTNARLSVAEVKEKMIKAVDKVASLKGKVQSGGRLNLSKLFVAARR